MRNRSASAAIRRLFFAVVLAGLLAPCALQAAMTDYCSIPPYVVQNIQPNVMVVVDVSGSMFNTAYIDGFNTTTTSDDNPCTSSSSRCTGFTNPGTYPAYKYYGYFNSDYWYTYNTSSKKFIQSAPKTGSGLTGSRTKNSNEWDGNFLNWLTMRRTDILRKVLTGGDNQGGEASGWDRLIGEAPDDDSRGAYMSIANASTVTSYTGTSSRDFTFNTGSGTSTFNMSGDSTTYYVSVVVPSPVSGVLQDVVGARARVGLTIYNSATGSSSRGGKIIVPVTSGSLSSMVTTINTTRPFTNTPLAETLWTVTGYFAQQASMLGGPGPRYQSGDFTVANSADPLNYGTSTSPRFPVCSKSFVLYITDGEPCSDGDLPTSLQNYANGRSAFNCNGSSCPSVAKPNGGSFPASTFPSCGAGDYVAGIEDVALYMHTTDLRSSTLGVNDISGTQNLTLYTIFAFGKGSTLLRYAAINGGFDDNGSHVPYPQDTWDKNNDGDPDNFYEAADGAELEQSVRDAFSGILKRASSGTAASVLASGEGSGANLIQAVFYPRRSVGNDIVWWTGRSRTCGTTWIPSSRTRRSGRIRFPTAY